MSDLVENGSLLLNEVACIVMSENGLSHTEALKQGRKILLKAIPIIRRAIEDERPRCPGVIVNRTSRQIGYTIALNEPLDVLEEKEVPCPLLAEIRKAVAEEIKGELLAPCKCINDYNHMYYCANCMSEWLTGKR